MFLTSLVLGLVCQATLVPDPQYEPKVGDVVRIYRREGRQLKPAPVAFDADGWRALQRSVEAKDNKGIKDLEDKHLVAWLDSGTEIRVIEVNATGFVERRQRETGLLIARGQPPSEHFAAVRVSDGDLKDKVVLVDQDWVKRNREVG